MSRRIKVVVNDNAYLVEVGDLAVSPLEVRVNGQLYQIKVETVDETAPVVAAPTIVAPTVAGVSRPARQSANQPGAVAAPMPGNIIDIYVEVGEAISKDQVLCSLEAMKMQNAIRSSRDGVIATVAVQPGQSVGHGELLFTFE